MGLSDKQKQAFAKPTVADIFPEYYILKVNQFDDVAKDHLDEWIYFLKNSEVKDDFQAKGLQQAGQVLDVMRLNDQERYGYYRHMDALSVKASEILSLKSEAEFELKAEIAINFLKIGVDNKAIAQGTGLSLEQIEQLRRGHQL